MSADVILDISNRLSKMASNGTYSSYGLNHWHHFLYIIWALVVCIVLVLITTCSLSLFWSHCCCQRDDYINHNLYHNNNKIIWMMHPLHIASYKGKYNSKAPVRHIGQNANMRFVSYVEHFLPLKRYNHQYNHLVTCIATVT